MILGQHLTDRESVIPLSPGDSKADKADRDKDDTLNPLCALTPGPQQQQSRQSAQAGYPEKVC